MRGLTEVIQYVKQLNQLYSIPLTIFCAILETRHSEIK